ncbi:LAMI_0C01244g1_1 [Lachancea mirantina]|uniref:LAMI_0C01244g1_1 n=1 Tax=Lachancea mirantina TaxID=1230905 RepID=A0A1G4J006_9SACH|nr:LAMI_0C01244g1_1 [Lachancea mirantina]
MGDQQVVFMNPQAESLDCLYSLAGRLTRQLAENKAKRDKLLRDIDVLAREVNVRAEDQGEVKDENIPVINAFLQRRNKNIYEWDGETNNKVDVLRQQNVALREMLNKKKESNLETMALLKLHEKSLIDVVAVLREDVLSYHQELLEKCRSLYERRVFQAEDTEFRQYMENVKDVEQLMDLSKIFRALLRLAS